MDNYQEKLEYLIGLKKTKKDPNKIERAEFEEAWMSCAKAEGFSDNTETYLYNGFTYCGARPYKKYLQLTENPAQELQKLYRGKLYGDNCANTAPLLIHLLCLLINDKHQQYSLIISVIQHLPAALTNKENKIYGQAGRAVKKYFLDELQPDASLPDFKFLIDKGLTIVSAKLFCNSLNQILTDIDYQKYSNKSKSNIRRILNWINPKENSDISEVKNTVGGENNNQIPKLTTTENFSCSYANPNTNKEDETSEPTKSAESIETERKVLLYQQKIKDLTNQLNQLAHEKNSSKKQIAELMKRVSEQSGEINSLQGDRDMYIKRNAELQEKLDGCNAVIEMLRRDRLKQSDEILHRIASGLKTYYEDYRDALELDMSLELGENLRDQMGEIFKILISSGIAIK